MIGCSGQDYPGAPRGAVSGTVTLDGEPVPSGTLYLMPGAGVTDGRISGATIKEGKFEVRESRGPNVGTYRVGFELTRPTGEYRHVDQSGVPYDEIVEYLTPQNLTRDRSDHTVEIQAGENTFHFAATSDGKLDISRQE